MGICGVTAGDGDDDETAVGDLGEARNLLLLLLLLLLDN